MPRTASASSPSTFATACVTPLPPYSAPPSRSSIASSRPVDAPDGTAARPNGTRLEANVDLDGRVAARVEDLPRVGGSDGAQRNSSFAWSKYASLASRLSSRNVSPFAAALLLGALDPIAEPARHRAQGELRIDVDAPRDVHRGEEDVAQLLEHVRVRLRLGRRLASGLVDRLLQLANLVVEIVERAANVRILEVDRRCAPLQLAREEQRRQRLRHVVEDSRASLLLALDRLPVRAHAAGRLRLDLAEDMRMPAHELLVNQPRNGSRGRRCRVPRAAARGSRPGTAGRRARRAASRRSVRSPRPRPRTPPRPCAARSCAPSARDPTGSRAATGASALAGRARRRRARPRRSSV